MNIQVLDRKTVTAATKSKLAIGDGDIHPRPKSDKELFPFLEARWQRHLQMFGMVRRQGYQSGPEYPKSQPGAMRLDSYPPEGGGPGSSLSFMQQQHLDPNNVQLGILNPLRSGQGAQNADLAAALCTAVNDWQIAEWTSQDSRLKGSVVIPYEDAAASVREIERRAGDPNYVQVFMQTRMADPPGQRRYWPIYEAIAESGFALGIHAFGNGGHPITGGGWPSYYIEEMTAHAQNAQSVLTSFVIEGVFERFPKLRLVLIEAGFAWLPPLCWRLDKNWRRLKDEVPHLKRLPSEYIRDHVWLTTQPMEEPDTREHVLDTIEWIGWDRLIFATDYPHWDFDNPAHVLALKIGESEKRKFFLENAREVYRIAE